MENQRDRKRVRDDSDNSEHDSPEVKKLREELLYFLDDTDAPCPSIQDLDSVLRSLEEEISVASYSPAPAPAPAPAPLVDLTSDSCESQPDLGFLLEASDDELGLPPSVNSCVGSKQEDAELVRVSSTSGEFWGFEDQVLNYDSFGLAPAENSEFVGYDGLFGYPDFYFDSTDFSDFSWRSQTLPAQ